LDIDLDDPAASLPPMQDPSQVLVWAGEQVLGMAKLPPLGPVDAKVIRERLAEWFAVPLIAREDVTARPAPALVLPEELTVVVCTRDRPQLLRSCLQHLARLSPPPGEVLVVDNAPTTGETRTLAAEFGVGYVVEPEPGLDRARNRGWQSARGSVVVYVDDDARAHPRFVAGVARGFLDRSVGAVTGLVVPAELVTRPQQLFEQQGGMRKGFQRQVFHRDSWSHGVQAYRLGVGTNMAFRRHVLAELGGFDPRLDVGTRTRGGGDVDMLYRALLDGWAVVYEPGAVVRHIHRRDWPGLVAQMRDNGVAFAALLAKYRQDPRLSAEARRELWRWHTRRHLGDVLRAIRRRQLWRLHLLLAEAGGSRRGRAALATETLGPEPA
jgi:glycosyltransferase involved in cell wall biosynthesis